mgnify:CR=1 FL=1|tara:strand:- start:556 stop:1044 length:489 start_codon:yes stop_codon:yes gene_type:complete
MTYYIYLKKILHTLLLLTLIGSCNYKPLFDENQLGKIEFKKVETTGDKRVSQLVINKLNITKEKTGKYALYVDGKKNIVISNKSTAGKVLEYSITLSYTVDIVNNLNGNKIYSKTIVNTENYKPSDTYSDTISRERKIIENLANLVAKQILNEISLVLSDGI